MRLSEVSCVMRTRSYTHVKEPVVRVRGRWIIKKMKTPNMHYRSSSATLSQLAFPEESDPTFPWEKSQQDNAVNC